MRWLAFLLVLSVATPAYAGASRSFDGVDDSIDFGDMANLDTEAELSCGCWIKTDNLTQDHAIISKFNTTDQWTLINDDVGSSSGRTNTFKIFIEESSSVTSTFIEGATDAALQDTWQWIFFVFNNLSATGLSLYIDGVADANSPVSTANVDDSGGAGTSTVRIAERNDGALDRVGNSAYCQCWNVDMSATFLKAQSQVQYRPETFPTSEQLVAPLFGSNSPEIDLSGAGASGTVAGATESFDGPPVMMGDAPL